VLQTNQTKLAHDEFRGKQAKELKTSTVAFWANALYMLVFMVDLKK
jgi:hypothetical protein